PVGEPGRLRLLPCALGLGGAERHALDRAAVLAGEVERRAADAAAHVEDAPAGRYLGELGEPVHQPGGGGVPVGAVLLRALPGLPVSAVDVLAPQDLVQLDRPTLVILDCPV